MAVARELRKEVEALIAAGARIIQIDEPAVSVRPEELPVAIEGMRAVVEGLDAYFVTHICYGAFEKIYPEMLDIPVDNFDLEMTNSGLELLDLFARHRFTKDISFGVLDVHTHTVEDEAGILAAVRRGLEVLPAEAVWVDPDCGLKTRSVEESVDKLRAMARAVEALRASHGGGRKGR
jgi:5-methyltetrahydropteroyltriglutamate--homocysteine methyltransferase